MIHNKLYVHMTPNVGSNNGPFVPAPTASTGPSMVFTKKRPSAGSIAIRRSKAAAGVSGPIKFTPKPKIVKKPIPTFSSDEKEVPDKSNTTSNNKKRGRIVLPDASSQKSNITEQSHKKAEISSSPVKHSNDRSTTAAHSNGPVNHSHTEGKTPVRPTTAPPAVSLFTGNPTIPYIKRIETTPVTEQVFSGDSFDKLEISPVLSRQLNKVGCVQMTVVQQRGVPPIMAGKDVLIKSQTGSGKTLAYAVPIINALMTATPPIQRTAGVMAVIIVPTRELAQQTHDWIEKLCKACINIVPAFLRGGENRKAEKDRLKKGVNILVATPGRLLDHINTTERMRLSGVRYLVLDEADRMMEMGYERDIASIIDAIVDAKQFGDDKRIQAKKDAREDRNSFGKRNMPFEESRDNKKRKGDENESYLAKQMKKITGADNDHNSGEESDEEERPLEDIDDFTEPPTSSNTVDFTVKPNPSVLNVSTILVNSGAHSGQNTTASPSNSRYQTIMLSATLTDQVQQLAGINLRDPEMIDVSGCGSVGMSGASIAMPKLRSNVFMVVPPKLRLVTLAAFIISKCMYGQLKKMLVFMASQDMVDYHTVLFKNVLARYGTVTKEAPVPVTALDSEVNSLFDKFGKPGKKKKTEPKKAEPDVELEPLFDFMQLRGNMNQEERTKVFNKFKAASSGVLLCTDVASRGLDLPAVTWIVQYTAPSCVTDFVHRVGRTSRADTMGSALLMLAPSEVDFVTKLDEQHIKLDEAYYADTLKAFTQPPRRRDPQFRIPRSAEEGATTFQSKCEKLLLADADMKKLAADGYLSFIRAYASYPKETRHIFSYKGLHQGHYAKSFCLRDAPSSLGAGAASKAQEMHRSKKEALERKEQRKIKSVRAQKRGAVPRMASTSEFDSGLDGLAEMLIKRKMEQNKRHNHIRTNKGGAGAHGNTTTKTKFSGSKKQKNKVKSSKKSAKSKT